MSLQRTDSFIFLLMLSVMNSCSLKLQEGIYFSNCVILESWVMKTMILSTEKFVQETAASFFFQKKRRKYCISQKQDHLLFQFVNLER